LNLAKQISVEILLLALIGLLLGLMGPFGTYAMPTGIRLIYWVSFILVGYLLFRPVSFVANWLSDISQIPIAAATLIAVSVSAFPLTIIIAIAIGGFSFANNPMLQDGFGLLYLQVAAIGIGIFLLMRLLFGRDPASASEPAAPSRGETDLTPQCRLHNRLPSSFGPILALGVEDHYVRVFRDDGRSEMLLMRLSDAIAETDGIDGLQVHRSWWVANAGVRRSRRDGRNVILLLDNGMEVPVSRNNIAAIRAKDWLS